VITMSFRRVAKGVTRAGLAALAVSAVVAPAWAQDQRTAQDEAMRRAFSKAIVTAAAESSASGAIAADEQAPSTPSTMDALTKFFSSTEVSGFVDFYYEYNFNKVNPQLRVFDTHHNSFTMSVAEIALEKKPTTDSRGGYRIDLQYGPTAAIVHSSETPANALIFQNVEQAYVSWLVPTTKALQIDFGEFVTPIGNEVIESKDNWNYTRSLLFDSIPFYNVGLRAAYTASDQVTITGFLVNGWNQNVDSNNGKTVAVQAAIKPTTDWSIILNYMGGPEFPPKTDKDWRHLVDGTVSYTASKQLSLAANFDYDKEGATSTNWWGIAGYLRYQANDQWAIAPRFEYLDDKDGLALGTFSKLSEGTVTLEYKDAGGVLIRVEYRHDFSDPAVFLNSDGVTKKGQDTLAVGVVYAFSTKNP